MIRMSDELTAAERTPTVAFRLPSLEARDELAAVAGSTGQTPGQWARQAVLERLAQEIEKESAGSAESQGPRRDLPPE